MASNGAFAMAVLLVATALSSMDAGPAHLAVEVPADCEQVAFSVMHCTSYMLAGSNLTEPDSRCCPGIQEVVDASPECLCSALVLEQKMGFELDMTRALGLPKLCQIEIHHSIIDCAESPSPSPSPSSPSPEGAPPPAPESPGAPSAEAPKSSSVPAPSTPSAEAPKPPSVPSPSAPPVLPTPTSPGPAGAKGTPAPQVNPADSGAGDVSVSVMAILIALALAVLSHLEY